MTKQTATAAEQMKIHLNQVYNPHPKLLEAYKDSMHLFTDFEALRPEYVLEERLFKIAAMSQSPIKHGIGSVYRKALGNKEYVLWFEHLSCFDYYKNPVEHTRFMGRISLPDIITSYSLPSTIRSDVGKLEAQKMPSEISGHHTEYQYPFEQLK